MVDCLDFLSNFWLGLIWIFIIVIFLFVGLVIFSWKLHCNTYTDVKSISQTNKQTNPFLPNFPSLVNICSLAPSPLLGSPSSAICIRLVAATLSRYFHNFLCLPTTPSHICICLLIITVFSLPIIAYIRSPLCSFSPPMLAFSLYFNTFTCSLSPTCPMPLFSCNHSALCSPPRPMFAHLPLTTYVCFPFFSPLLSTLLYCAYATCFLVVLNHTFSFCTSLVHVVAYLLIYNL